MSVLKPKAPLKSYSALETIQKQMLLRPELNRTHCKMTAAVLTDDVDTKTEEIETIIRDLKEQTIEEFIIENFQDQEFEVKSKPSTIELTEL